MTTPTDPMATNAATGLPNAAAPVHVEKMIEALGQVSDEALHALRASELRDRRPVSHLDVELSRRGAAALGRREAQLRSDAGLSDPNVPPSYAFRLDGHDLQPEAAAGVSAELHAFGRALGMESDLGTAVTGRLAAVSAALKSMTPEEQQAWADRQERALEHIARGPENLAAWRASVQAMLLAAPQSDIAKALANGALAARDPFILSQLKNHAARLEYFAKRQAK